MEKDIYDDKTGLWYERRGDYYFPCLTADKIQRLGIWGQRHLRYLQEYRSGFYTGLLLSGRLPAYLAEIDAQAQELYNRLITLSVSAQDVTESLKECEPMVWVQRMNNIRSCAVEVVEKELIYADSVIGVRA